MPFRRKTSKQLEEAGQPIEKSLSSPNISEFSQNPGGNYLGPGLVSVQRKKSWLSRLLKPFRKSKGRTLTEPTEQPTSSCFPLQKSSSTFYASPYSPIERAPSQKKNAEAKRKSSESEYSESSDEKREVPATTLPTFIQPTLLAELKVSLKEREQFNGSEQLSNNEQFSPEPICDNPKPIKKKSFKTKSRPLSADSGLFSGDLRNLEQIIEHHYDVPDIGLFDEQIIVSNNKIQPIKPRKKWNNTGNQDFVKCKDFTYIEPQPIEPLHKFPKPRPPVNRRPSTRKGSKTADDLAILNPRRSEAELEDIIRKINEIPPPDAEPPTQNLSEIEIPSARIHPIPKKRTILPSSSLKSQEQSQTVQITDDEIETNHAQSSLMEQALLESMHLNQNTIKPELPPKTRELISRSNTMPRSAVSSPDESISVYDTVKAFKERIINQDDLDINPMKRVRTLPVRFHGTKDIQKESSKIFTRLLNSHQSQKQKTELLKHTYTLNSNEILQNNLVAQDVKSKNKLQNKENEGEEANSPGKIIPEIRKDTNRQNKTISISRASYMTEFQNTMDDYLKEIHKREENFNQKTPPNTPEQFEEPNELQDETLIEINSKEISDSEPSESTEKPKKEPPNSLNIKPNNAFNSCIITNDIYESLSPLTNFEETERFVQEERSSSDHDMITTDDTYDSTKFTFGIVESSENSKEHARDISRKTETTNKSQIQETIMNLKKTKHTFKKPYIQAKPDDLVRKGAIRQKRNSSSDDQSSNHLKPTHYGKFKTESTSSSSEQVHISTKDSLSPKLYLNSEPLNQEEPETKRQRSKSIH